MFYEKIKRWKWVAENAGFGDVLNYFRKDRMPLVHLNDGSPIFSDEIKADIKPLSAPFLMLKCTGFKHMDAIETVFRNQAVSYSFLGGYGGYGRAAMKLYNLIPENDHPEKWLWLGILQQIAPNEWDEVKIWTFDSAKDKITQLKRTIRRRLGLLFYRARYRGAEYRVTINPVHIPDAGNIEAEWEILASTLYKLS
jgi:hypothetical protein